MKDKSLVQFVRDRKGQPRGLVVATTIDDTIRLGWSYTNTKAGDRFNKERAYKIAFGRAEFGKSQNVTTPRSVVKVLNQISKRAVKYYKDLPLIVTTL
jgi:hypothetical protein